VSVRAALRFTAMGNLCTAEKREEIAEQMEEVVEKAQQVLQEAAEAVAEKVEEAQEAVAEVVADAKDAAADTMTAAVAAVTGAMIVEFDAGKGAIKTVDFKSQVLGFDYARGGGGCCASAPKASVIVSKVAKGQQADALGVKKSWAIKSVNGTDVTGLEEAKKLLEEGRLRLPEVAEVAQAQAQA